MEIGAVDCIGKPSIEHPNSFDDLPAQGSRRRRRAAAARRRRGGRGAVDELATYKPDGRLVAIGASTGGVEALIAVLAGYPENCPPTVVTAAYARARSRKTFAQRLDRLTARPRSPRPTDGAPIVPGRVYVAPGSAHASRGRRGGDHPRCRLQQRRSGQRPPALGRRAVPFGRQGLRARSAVGVILTGMGRDGAEGLLAMRQAGARTLGQNEAI